MAEGYEPMPLDSLLIGGGLEFDKQTLGGDVLERIQLAPNGITYYRNSNSPTHNPGGDWGSYIIFKQSGVGKAIYFDESLLAFSTNVIQTSTDITWYKTSLSAS